jgi:uncharacterized repeat protein (TIGR03803 family)
MKHSSSEKCRTRLTLCLTAFILLLYFESNGQTDEFWGMTKLGGTANRGVIFKTNNTGGDYLAVHSFQGTDGSQPEGSLTFFNGKLYGMTLLGGLSNSGVIFEYDPATNTYSKKIDLNSIDGNFPSGSLSVFNNKLWGVTRGGGVDDAGVIFTYEPATNTYTKKFEFQFANGIYFNGRQPTGELISYNGKLYGMTIEGGGYNLGVIFEFDPTTNSITNRLYLEDNIGNKTGGEPFGSLVEYNNKLYGMTGIKGEYGYGTLFEYTPPFNFIKKIDFNYTLNGGFPTGSLIVSGNKLYGMVQDGGSGNAYGLIFNWDPSILVPAPEPINKLFDFEGPEGRTPKGTLLQYNDKFYGLTGGGGNNGSGVLFEFTMQDNHIQTYTVKHHFGQTDGNFPHFTKLIAAPTGCLTPPPNFIGDYSTVTLACNPGQPAIEAAIGTATATDSDGTPTITISNDQLDFEGCDFSLKRTWTATDACGKTATVSRTVNWKEDNTPPVFTGNYTLVSLGCNPLPSAITSALGSATATDACSAPTITIISDQLEFESCFYLQKRTFLATDDCGNTATKSRSVKWISDQTPPLFTGNYSTITLGYDPPTSDINNALGTATATDACSGIAITSSDGSVQSTGCNREQTRTFTATDGCGNFATTSRIVKWKQGCKLQVSVGDLVVMENVGTALVPVSLNYPAPSTVTVNYKTVNGTAKHPKDFITKSGTLTFLVGQMTQYVSITIIADNNNEPDEEFFVSLTNATNVIIDDDQGKVTITEIPPGSITRSTAGNEKDQNEITRLLVPNPQRKQDALKFYGIGAGTFDIILFDITGKMVADLKNYRNDFSLRALKPGLYFYHVMQKRNNNITGRTTGKLLIMD